MSNFNLRMRRCFKFYGDFKLYGDSKMLLFKLGLELHNLIKKFQTILNINKMQTEFPRSRIFPHEVECIGGGNRK